MDPLQLRNKPCFDPEALALIQHAFEQTWAEIAPRFSSARHAEVRNVLATAVMEAVRGDDTDAAVLRTAGLQAMEQMYPIDMLMSLWTDPLGNSVGKILEPRVLTLAQSAFDQHGREL